MKPRDVYLHFHTTIPIGEALMEGTKVDVPCPRNMQRHSLADILGHIWEMWTAVISTKPEVRWRKLDLLIVRFKQTGDFDTDSAERLVFDKLIAKVPAGTYRSRKEMWDRLVWAHNRPGCKPFTRIERLMESG